MHKDNHSMAWEKRIVWSEGMMLQPQHFQQQSRYHESQLRNAIGLCQPHSWGIFSVEIDKSHLKTGKFSIAGAEGILPDGSYFCFPNVDVIPAALDITEDHLNKTLYLALTIRRHGNTETMRDNHEGIQYRYQVTEHDARDISGTSSLQQTLEVAGLSFCLLSDNDNLNEFSCIPIGYIEDVSESGVITLKNDFIYPALNIKQHPFIKGFISELVNLAQHRVNALSARVSVLGKATTTEVSDFLMLQTLNRHLPLIKYLDSAEHITPLDLYQKFISLIGDMCTFIKADKQVPELPTYQHTNLTETFNGLIDELRQAFSVVLEQNSINIPLQEKKYGIRVGPISDKTLFTSASFILAVTADISPDEIRQYFAPQVKIGAVEQIKELVNLQLPGVQLNSLAVAPREIPYQRNYVYFELLPTGEYWTALAQSGGIALHIGTNFPNLSMELWAIRSK